MHFRRMDPQPPASAIARRILISRPLFEMHAPGFYKGIEPPEDMQGARPWRDRDGVWYWRRLLP